MSNSRPVEQAQWTILDLSPMFLNTWKCSSLHRCWCMQDIMWNKQLLSSYYDLHRTILIWSCMRWLNAVLFKLSQSLCEILRNTWRVSSATMTSVCFVDVSITTWSWNYIKKAQISTLEQSYSTYLLYFIILLSSVTTVSFLFSIIVLVSYPQKTYFS